MFLLSRRLGSRAGSPALLATARDNLTDMVSSAMALVGYLLGRFVVTEADAIAALLVAAWIARAAAATLLDGLRQLTGGAAPSELEPLIVDAVRAVPGVRAVERVIMEYVGPKINVDIHIKMAGDVTLEHVHAVSHQVRTSSRHTTRWTTPTSHVEPYRGEDGPARPGDT
jgi:cation diffusion facilitator family transporter